MTLALRPPPFTCDPNFTTPTLSLTQFLFDRHQYMRLLLCHPFKKSREPKNLNGATIKRLTHNKRATGYSDLATSPQIEYLVLACEEGGRWGPDQYRLIRSLVRAKVASIHPLLRRRSALAYTGRWRSILSIGAQTVAADCILGRYSPVPTPATVLPLASVLPSLDVGTETSRVT